MNLRVNFDYVDDDGNCGTQGMMFAVDVDGIIEEAFVEMAKQCHIKEWEINDYEIVFPSV